MKLLHFAFIGAFPGRYPQHRLNGGQNFVQTLPLNSDTMSVDVCGVKYSLFSDDVRKHPGSLFEKHLHNHHSDEPVSIYRDGTLFKFVNAFLVNGQLPKDSYGRGTLGHDMLHALKDEATFFGLASLEEECARTAGDVSLPLQDYSPVAILPTAPHQLNVAQRDGSAARTLHQVWHPLTMKGSLPEWIRTDKLIRETTLGGADVKHLILLAKNIPPANTISDVSTCLLSSYALKRIEQHIDASKLFPDVEKVDIHARKLSVRTAGETQDHTIDITEENDCLGFVEVLLNSSFTGGELCATQNGDSTIVRTEPIHYIAMHPDANWSVGPVTSGTRVSLVLGMYGAAARKVPTYCTGKVKYGYWGPLLESGGSLSVSVDEEIPHLIGTAKYLCPEQVTADAKNFEIDALFLNEEGLLLPENIKALKGTLRSMFPNRELAFRAQKLQIRTGDLSGHADEEVSNNIQDKKEGFLGTVVLLPRREFTGGAVRVTGADGEVSKLDVRPDHWYAVTAGGASTVNRITGGNRLSLHYDIYDVTPEHDPLALFNANDTKSTIINAKSTYYDDDDDSDDSDDSYSFDDDSDSELSDFSDDDDDLDDINTDTNDVIAVEPHISQDETALLTRATASERVKSEALAAVEAELSTLGTDALLICLQHVYPAHFFHPKGGDRALYNILTSQDAGTDLYDVQPVGVTLHTAPDDTGRKKIISLCTGSPNCTQLIVPITLSSEHQSANDTDTYTVSGLRVTKKKKN